MATSGTERSDRNPEDAYDVDLRRVDPEERTELERGGINKLQGRVANRLKAAKAAGKYRKTQLVYQPLRRDGRPYLRGGSKEYSDAEIPVPGFGDKFGRQGSYSYAEKPERPGLSF